MEVSVPRLFNSSSFLSDSDNFDAAVIFFSRYAFLSIFTAQIGFILLLNIFAFTRVDKDSVMPPPVDYCTTYEDLCTKLMDHLDCPHEYQGVYACDKMPKHGHDPGWAASTWNGNCTCGAFYATERIAELIVDSQSKRNVTLLPMWPSKVSETDETQ